MDPQQRDGENSIRIMYDLFDPLFEINQKTELKPGVAEKYEISDDYKTYTFYLRKNIGRRCKKSQCLCLLFNTIFTKSILFNYVIHVI